MRREFTSCFVGIPLPQQFQAEFEQLLDGLASIHPSFKLVQKSTPHVTLYYLDEQSQDKVQEIANIIKEPVSRLNAGELTIGGLGVFDAAFPRVLFLRAAYPPALREVNSIFRERLNEYYAADNNLPFNPHLTVARIATDKARKAYEQNRGQIKKLLDSKTWRFPITEVIIYGVDSRTEPEGQQKLASVMV